MTPTPFYFLLAVLAVYRLAYLMTIDHGPSFIFLRWREYVRRRYGENSWQFEGATCPICQSVWYAVPAACLFALPWLAPALFALAWLAISGACVVLHWLVLVLMKQVNT